MAKLTKKKLLAMRPSEISKLKGKPLNDLLRQARTLYEGQAKKFSKYKDTMYSHALEKIQDYYEDGFKPLNTLTNNKKHSELFRIQEFFEAKTSTIPGTRKVAIEQDARIFGVDEDTGKPLRRMTLEERTNFWAAYNEFISMEKESYVRNMGSNTIQQYLGQMIIGSRKNKDDMLFDYSTFKELKRRLESSKNEEDWETTNYEHINDDILSGKRSG